MLRCKGCKFPLSKDSTKVKAYCKDCKCWTYDFVTIKELKEVFK